MTGYTPQEMREFALFVAGWIFGIICAATLFRYTADPEREKS